MKNERGGSLVIVLLVVLVFTIFGMGLLTMNISAAKQFNKKEEQVQARHLAEMGVLYYKASIKEAIKEYHKKEFEYVYINKNGVTTINQDASLKKYYKQLCEATNGVSIDPYASSLGRYSLVRQYPDCEPSEVLNEIVFIVESTGEVEDTMKIIDAKVIISSVVSPGDGGTSGSNNAAGNPPEKPGYPEGGWVNKPYTTYLDDIKGSNPVKVLYGLINNKKQSSFVTSAFVEIVGSVDMPKGNQWTFNDHLLIAGDFKTNTGGQDKSKINVKKDFFIGGAFHHLSNHTSSDIGGNFIIMGKVTLGTKSNLSVAGNAFFGSGISLVDTHARVIIQKNAYFKLPLGSVENKANVCVKGDIFLWKNNNWAHYLPTDTGYGGFAKSCLGTPTGKPFNWGVESGVNAEYK